MKKSIANYVNIDPKEIPTREELEGAIVRLKKCAEILTRISSKKDPHPSTCIATASFLERLLLDPRIRKNPVDEKNK